MGDLLIRNISSAVKADIDRLARENGTSLSEAAQDVLRAGLEVMSKRQSGEPDLPHGQKLHKLLGDTFGSDAEFGEFQKVMEELRSRPGRPVPDFE